MDAFGAANELRSREQLPNEVECDLAQNENAKVMVMDEGGVVEAAKALLSEGFTVVPLLPGSKHPSIKGWTTKKLDAAELAAKLTTDSNIGIVLGEMSGGLVDVDLDDEQAVLVAPYLLPATGMRHGRAGKPNSHYWYRIQGSVKTAKFRTSCMIVELRGDGAVTAVPPSVHPSGERYTWDEYGEPAEVSAAVLHRCVAKVAAAVVLADEWIEGKRHEIALALAGTLARSEWSEDEVCSFVEAIADAADDPDVSNRLAAVTDTFAKLMKGERVTGWSLLTEMVSTGCSSKVRQWLGIKPGTASPKESQYFERDGSLYMRKSGRDGGSEVLLANFSARITREVFVTDGSDQDARKELDLSVTVCGQEHRFTVPAEHYNGLGWVDTKLPSVALVTPYAGKSNTPVAVKIMSGEVPTFVGVGHTGWRQHNGAWVYVHANGIIGTAEDNAVEPRLEPTISTFAFPKETPTDLGDCIRSAVNLTKLGPPEVMYPLLAAAFRAVIGKADFGLWLVGQTGVFKSEIASLVQRFFGAEMDAHNLPGSWTSTENALEQQAYRLKDALFVVDDWKVTPLTREAMERRADRLFRGLGNQQGRARLRSDLSSRPTWYPRSLLLSTGEQAPEGASLLARMLVVSLKKGDIESSKLTECQQTAHRGEYAAVMRAFIEWLAPRLNEVRNALKKDEADAEAGEGLHARTPRMATSLLFAYRMFLTFAVEHEALSEDQRDIELESARRAINAAADQQRSYVIDTDTVQRYLDAVRSLLSSGKAHICPIGDGAPQDLTSWGWVKDDLGFKPRGHQIGWVSEHDLYLDPATTYSLVQPLMGQSAGNSRSINNALYDRGLLKSTDLASRKTYTVRKTIGGSSHNVLHLNPSTITGLASSTGAEVDQMPAVMEVPYDFKHSVDRWLVDSDPEAKQLVRDAVAQLQQRHLAESAAADILGEDCP